MRWLASAALLLGLTSPASADRFTFGISLGHSEGGDSGAARDSARGVFGELRVHRRASFQLELARLSGDDYQPDVRRYAGSLLVDLGGPRRVQPYLLAGLGDEHLTDESWIPNHFHTREIGVGARVRLGGGLVLAGDVRRGERGSAEPNPVILDDVAGATRPLIGPLRGYDWQGYTALRISLGVAF